MAALSSSVLQAAQAFVLGQHLPGGCLYVIATPIGNLADITLRALAVLSQCDLIIAEDTRQTHKLLQGYGISPTKIIRGDTYTEHSISSEALNYMRDGKRVALVSDAGTPAISDPGAALVKLVREAGHAVIPIPGVSSVITLLSAAGLEDTPFSFLGFAPTAAKARDMFCEQLAHATCTQVFFEAPHRAMATLQQLAACLSPEQRLVVGRELTKRYETIAVVAASELGLWLTTQDKLAQGELVIAVSAHKAAGKPSTQTQVSLEPERLLRLLLPHLPLKTAVALTSEATGLAKNALYDQALSLKNAL